MLSIKILILFSYHHLVSFVWMELNTVTWENLFKHNQYKNAFEKLNE